MKHEKQKLANYDLLVLPPYWTYYKEIDAVLGDKPLTTPSNLILSSGSGANVYNRMVFILVAFGEAFRRKY